MSTHPRATVAARQPQPELVSREELDRIRCEFRSGLHEPVVGRLLDHIAIEDSAIHRIATRTLEDGTAEEQARVAEALELTDPNPPIHVRIEFDYVPPCLDATAIIALLRDRTPVQLAKFPERARVTVTYRGESESWETELP